jgi:translocation and assembly module TamB
VDIRLRPLEPNPVVSATGWIRKLDLGRLEPPLPKTAIDLDFDLLNPRALPQVEAVPDSTGSTPVVPLPAAGQGSAAWQGSVSLANAASGPWHEKLLPLRSLSADLQLDATAESEPTRLQLSNLKLEMPGAKTQSTVAGAVNVLLNDSHRVAGSVLPVIVAGLQFRNIDVAQFVDGVAPTAMNGNFDLTRDLFNLELTQSEGPLRQAVTLPGGGKAAVRAAGRISDNAVHLDSALVQLDKSQLTVSGRATLTEPIDLAMGGSLTEVDLATWIPRNLSVDERFRKGLVNADWAIDGVVSPSFDAQVSMNLKQSSLAGHPLSGQVRGQFRLPTDQASLAARNVDSRLRLGSNVVSINGNLGEQGDALRLSGLLADPALIDSRITGSVNIKAVVSGAPERMQARVDLSSKRLRWQDAANDPVVIEAAKIKAQMPVVTVFADDVPVNLDVRANRISAAGRRFDGVKLDVSGTAAKHEIEGAVRVNRHALSVQADGRLTSGERVGWTGSVNTLSSRGKVSARLQQPVAVTVSPGDASLNRLRLSVLDGMLALDRLQFNSTGEGAGSVAIAGKATDLPVGRILALAAETTGGDAAAAVPPELDRLRADANFDLRGSNANDLSGRFNLDLSEVAGSKPIGGKAAAAGIGLSGKNGARIRLQSGQLSGSVDLSLPSLAFSRRYTGDEWVVDGRLRLVSALGGTLSKPTWDARVYGNQLSLFQPALGWRFSRGKLEARVAGDQLTLSTLSLDSGDGRVSVNGRARMLRDAGSVAATGVLPLDGRFTLKADGLVIPIGPGQRLVLSGDSALASTRAGLTWTGALRADEGLIEIAGSGAPALPGDVQIQEEADKSAKPTADQAGKPQDTDNKKKAGDQSPKVRTELSIDLGQKLRIAGGGVNARLTGELRLHGDLPDAPRVTGDVIIRDGTYFAYNQELTIERGAVRFAGPLDNPLLDIVAIRPDLPVKAGVALGGTALSPKVQLTSTPPLSDAETLSWVVLGTPLNNAQEGAQSLALKQAAAAFIGSDDGSLSGGGLANQIGVNVGFGYASDTGQSQAVTDAGSPTGLPGSSTTSTVQANEKVFTLGKKLSDRLSVSYEKSLEGVWSLLRLQYEISNRLSLRAQTGTESALDLIYFFTFD